MNIDLISDVLGWSALINYAILILWFLFFTLAHDWIYHFHGKWFFRAVPLSRFL